MRKKENAGFIKDGPFMINHAFIKERFTVKDWIDIHLQLHGQQSDAEAWICEFGFKVDLYAEMRKLREIEQIELQYMIAAMNSRCVVEDHCKNYRMEEIIRINRILKKIAAKKEVAVLGEDVRLLFNQAQRKPGYVVALSCAHFNTELANGSEDFSAEDGNVICTFKNRKKAVDFVHRCLKKEHVSYLEMEGAEP